jgi:hypothetical protein
MKKYYHVQKNKKDQESILPNIISCNCERDKERKNQIEKLERKTDPEVYTSSLLHCSLSRRLELSRKN